jgi:hypothetical protein
VATIWSKRGLPMQEMVEPMSPMEHDSLFSKSNSRQSLTFDSKRDNDIVSETGSRANEDMG